MLTTHDLVSRFDVGRHAVREWRPTIHWVTHSSPSRRDPVHQFTAEQARRWDAWQQANAVAARHTDRVARLFCAAAMAATLVAIAAAMLR